MCSVALIDCPSARGTSRIKGKDQLCIRTQEGRRLFLPADEWSVTNELEPVAPAKKRPSTALQPAPVPPKACFIQVDVPLGSERVLKAVLGGIRAAQRHRPAVLVVELDTPGGLIQHAQAICAELERLRGTKSIAFVRGGDYGGALSAGALIAMACEDIYIPMVHAPPSMRTSCRHDTSICPASVRNRLQRKAQRSGISTSRARALAPQSVSPYFSTILLRYWRALSFSPFLA